MSVSLGFRGETWARTVPSTVTFPAVKLKPWNWVRTQRGEEQECSPGISHPEKRQPVRDKGTRRREGLKVRTRKCEDGHQLCLMSRLNDIRWRWRTDRWLGWLRAHYSPDSARFRDRRDNNRNGEERDQEELDAQIETTLPGAFAKGRDGVKKECLQIWEKLQNKLQSEACQRLCPLP